MKKFIIIILISLSVTSCGISQEQRNNNTKIIQNEIQDRFRLGVISNDKVNCYYVMLPVDNSVYPESISCIKK